MKFALLFLLFSAAAGFDLRDPELVGEAVDCLIQGAESWTVSLDKRTITAEIAGKGNFTTDADTAAACLVELARAEEEARKKADAAAYLGFGERWILLAGVCGAGAAVLIASASLAVAVSCRCCRRRRSDDPINNETAATDAEAVEMIP